jgi:sugar transferase (PEP-CTERM system associated)
LLPKVLVLGTGALAVQLGEIVKNLSDNYNFLGFVKESGKLAEAPNDTNGGNGSLFETAMTSRADSLVVALADRSGGYPLQEILRCKLHGISVFDAPAFFERVTGKMLIEHITPEWFIFSQGFQISHLKRGIKRCGDILFCLVMLPLLLPFLPLVVLIIKLDSPGPVFFRQVRVGENEKPFFLYKLRTMNNNAETQTGAVWAQTEDPRITRVGRFLRKSRLDEFPQLFNVLRGDMSLVGPRPERPEFVEQLQEIITYYSERHLIKPGITGWAQINYPYGSSVEDAIEKLRYDLYYLKNFSIPLDVLISMETIKVVLLGRGSR